jgi:hypothetical protein
MGRPTQQVSVQKFELSKKMANQSVKCLALLFVVTMAGALAPLGSAVASMNPTGPAWHARIVVKGQFADLMSAGSSLYAVSLATKGPASSGTRVVRVDPTSGKVVATSVVLPGITAPQFVDSGESGSSRRRSAPSESRFWREAREDCCGWGLKGEPVRVTCAGSIPRRGDPTPWLSFACPRIPARA